MRQIITELQADTDRTQELGGKELVSGSNPRYGSGFFGASS